VWLGNRFLATYFNGDTWFYHRNHLGSTAAITLHDGGSELEDVVYYPWGQSWLTAGTVEDLNFASLQGYDDVLQDYTTPNRRYSNSITFGRWLTPDPAGKNVVHLDDPQTWNMYAYVRNNPTTNVDPDGLDCISTSNWSTNGVTVTVERGDCDQTQGQYVNGTIDISSLTLTNGNLGYSYSNSETGVGGTGVISQPDPDEERLQGVASGVYNTAAGPVNFFAGATMGFLGFFGPGILEGSLALPLRFGLMGQPVIGKMGDLGDLGPSERELALPDQNEPQANWEQNSRRLRQEMASGRPIKDASALKYGGPDKLNTGFLRAERNLLVNRGWSYSNGYWYPPSR
jgi:RHS repeat-associated protein